MERTQATPELASQFGLDEGDWLYHSIVVHFENDAPIQVEDRHVDPALAPNYLQLDFSATTANAHLMQVAPLQGMRYQIEAALPDKRVAQMLDMAPGAPCLVLRRATLSGGRVASVVTLWHPADRYAFSGGID